MQILRLSVWPVASTPAPRWRAASSSPPATRQRDDHRGQSCRIGRRDAHPRSVRKFDLNHPRAITAPSKCSTSALISPARGAQASAKFTPRRSTTVGLWTEKQLKCDITDAAIINLLTVGQSRGESHIHWKTLVWDRYRYCAIVGPFRRTCRVPNNVQWNKFDMCGSVGAAVDGKS